MSGQRQLNALLFELQTAQSPLAQAKILARSWRTLRELSPTDRRLLARHAGFDGAEQILEGLASKQRGIAPAMLLQMLNKAKATDGASVGALLAALRNPSQRDEAIARGADLVAEVLRDPDDDDGPKEIFNALDELQAVEKAVQETPEEALAALNALQGEPVPPVTTTARIPGAPGVGHGAPAPPPKPKPQPKPQPRPQPARQAPRRVAPAAGWDRLSETTKREIASPAQIGSRDVPPAVTASSPRFDGQLVIAALGSERSSLSRLRVLERELQTFRGSSSATLRVLLEQFPSGWVRRRALVALIGEGIPADASQALELIAGLETEIDRRWCLGALAQRGDLQGPVLERSLELVTSAAGRRRLEAMAARY